MLVDLGVADYTRDCLIRAVNERDVEAVRQLASVLEAGLALDAALERFNEVLGDFPVGVGIKYGVWCSVDRLEVDLSSSQEPRAAAGASVEASPPAPTPLVKPLSRDRARIERSRLVRELYASGIQSTKEIVVIAAQRGHIFSVRQVASVLGVMHRTKPARKRQTLKALVFDLVLEKKLTDQNEVLRRVRQAWKKEINEGTFQEYFRMAIKQSKEREQALV